jgi:hypothetical protein
VTSTIWSASTTVAPYLRRRPRARPAPRPPSVPPAGRLEGSLLLTDAVPEVTLDRRQSSIGSLVLEIAGQGEIGVAWELQDTRTGLVSPLEGQLVSPELGRRPIVEHRQGTIVIGLRHVLQLRRLVVLVEGPESRHPYRVVASVNDGSTVEASFARTAPVIAAMAFYQVDGELIVRREGFDFETRADVAEAYGFAISWIPTRR